MTFCFFSELLGVFICKVMTSIDRVLVFHSHLGPFSFFLSPTCYPAGISSVTLSRSDRHRDPGTLPLVEPVSGVSPGRRHCRLLVGDFHQAAQSMFSVILTFVALLHPQHWKLRWCHQSSKRQFPHHIDGYPQPDPGTLVFDRLRCGYILSPVLAELKHIRSDVRRPAASFA